LVAFNTAQGLYLPGATPLIVPPDPSSYSFPSSVTIPKGSTQAYARITVNQNSNPDPNALYAIPLIISSTSYGAVSTNMGIEINFFWLN
jgi:hypothetical protein